MKTVNLKYDIGDPVKVVDVVKVGGLEIPVIGYVNCTGHPLPGDAENAAGIRRFLDCQSTRKSNITAL